MSAAAAVYRRVLRRETHDARTIPAVVVAVILALLLAGALVLSVWMLVDPGFGDTLVESVTTAASVVDLDAVRLAAGIVLLVFAVLLVFLAVSPGRRSRHSRQADRIGILVDDGVLADAAADLVAARCGVERSRVSVVVARRSVAVRVTPTSGVPVDEQAVLDAASEALSTAGFDAVARVTVARHGVLS